MSSVLQRSILWLWIFSIVGIYSIRTEDEINPDYWRELGRNSVKNSKLLHLKSKNNVARNVILFVGDGMGVSTITAIRIYKGQKKNLRGEEEKLSFDKFPFVSLSKTYGLNCQNSDSANTATAILCGVKANSGTLGVDGRVISGDCKTSTDSSTHLTSLISWAQREGKRTGIVTTTRVTHATPAASYAHCADRDWEGFTPDAHCEDIASQLITKSPGKDINVVLGGGVESFLPISLNSVGIRHDSRNLLNEWIEKHRVHNQKAEMVFNHENFTNINPKEVDYLLGLFNSSHIPFVTERELASSKVPTLVEMTEKAIEILKRGEQGYFLLVEGGRIDHGHHENSAIKALEEGLEFDAAVQKAVEMTNPEDTLLVVTADHSHPFTISGNYQKRGSNILGTGGVSDVDSMTMTILSYANGPGYKQSRTNQTEEQVVAKNYKQDTTYPMTEDTHGAEDVAVYGYGAGAHLFHGVHDQSYIPYAISEAAGLCPDLKECLLRSPSTASNLQHTLNTFLPLVLVIFYKCFMG